MTVLAGGCVEPPEAAIPDRPIRLADHLAAANVDSPLSGLAVAWTLGDLGPDVRQHEVWRAPLEEKVSESDCQMVARSDQPGEVLHCPSGEIRFEVEVEPLTRYRVRQRAFREQRSCFKSRVEERSETGTRLWTQDFPQPAAGSWDDSEVQLLTTPATRVLRLRFGRCDTWLGEIAVAALDLEPEQELALLKGEHLAPAADARLGVLKRGRLLPLADPETVAPPADRNYTVRDALFAPAPTDLTFDLRIPPAARLRFAYALSAESRPGDSAELRVIVRPRRGGEREIWRRSLALGTAGETWYWHDQQLDLEAFAGQQVRLTLSTRSRAPRGYVLWGNPVIDSPLMALGGGPNVILIAVDTLRADRLSCYGHSSPTSPQIDALARDGTRFDQATSPFNYTLPSFSSLLTGYGAVDSPHFIPAGRPTLASRFREAGWTTAAIMYKTYLYTGGFDQGFDEFFNVPRRRVRAEDSVRKALDWLDLNHDRRFFFVLHLNDPHQPFCQPAAGAPEPLRDRLADFGLALPIRIGNANVRGRSPRSPEVEEAHDCRECAQSEAFHAVARDIYDDAVTYADEQIGVFLRALEERGLYRPAVIALVSDHGEALWMRDQLFGHEEPTLYDDVTRVPLIVKPPAGAGWGRGRVVRSQVRHFDLMPTLLELAGLDPDSPPVDGRSLVPMLRPGKDRQSEDRTAVLLQRRYQLGGVRGGGWKYIASFRPPGRERLFYLPDDPAERHDVAAENPEVVAAARLELLEALLSARSGQTLVVTGEPPAADYSIEVTWDRPVSLAGLSYPTAGEPAISDDGSVRVEFAAAAAGRVLLLARFQAPEGEGVRMGVTMVTAGQAPTLLAQGLEVDRGARYRRGMLSRLVGEPARRVVVFKSLSEVAAAPVEAKVDERQLEALRALGYVQ